MHCSTIPRPPMNIRSKVKVGLGLGLGDRVAGVSYAPLSSATLARAGFRGYPGAMTRVPPVGAPPKL